MEGTFPSFGLLPVASHRVLRTVPDPRLQRQEPLARGRLAAVRLEHRRQDGLLAARRLCIRLEGRLVAACPQQILQQRRLQRAQGPVVRGRDEVYPRTCFSPCSPRSSPGKQRTGVGTHDITNPSTPRPPTLVRTRAITRSDADAMVNRSRRPRSRSMAVGFTVFELS